MSRNGKEFPSYVIEYAYRKYDCKCSRCGGQSDLEVHHILPLWVAAEYFPSLAAWVLKDAANAELVCGKCHDEIHRHNDFDVFNRQALQLLELMGRDFF